jgi:hypothetical protein
MIVRSSEHAADGDAGEGGDRDPELGALLVEEADEPRDVDEDMDAAITTAANVGWGRSRSIPGASSSMRVISTARRCR